MASSPSTARIADDSTPDSGSRDFREGFLVGLLVGEGHFGGDGRQPQVTLRMHVRHEAIFRWLLSHFPGGRLYGPYHHAGRDYFQWMARGSFLRQTLLPILDRRLSPALDGRSFQRFTDMKLRYRLDPDAVDPAADVVLPDPNDSPPRGLPEPGPRQPEAFDPGDEDRRTTPTT